MEFVGLVLVVLAMTAPLAAIDWTGTGVRANARRVEAAVRTNTTITEDPEGAADYLRRNLWPWWKVASGLVGSAIFFWPEIRFAFTTQVLTPHVYLNGLFGFVVMWSWLAIARSQLRRRRWVDRHQFDLLR